jgi:hypothetical protein
MAVIQTWRDAAFLKGDVEIMRRSGDEEGRSMLSDGKAIPGSPPQPPIFC